MALRLRHASSMVPAPPADADPASLLGPEPGVQAHTCVLERAIAQQRGGEQEHGDAVLQQPQGAAQEGRGGTREEEVEREQRPAKELQLVALPRQPLSQLHTAGTHVLRERQLRVDQRKCSFLDASLVLDLKTTRKHMCHPPVAAWAKAQGAVLVDAKPDKECPLLSCKVISAWHTLNARKSA